MPRHRATERGFLYKNHRRRSFLNLSEMIGFADTRMGRFGLTMDRDRSGTILLVFEPWGWGNDQKLRVVSRLRKIRKEGAPPVLVGDVNLLGELYQSELRVAVSRKTKKKIITVRLKHIC